MKLVFIHQYIDYTFPNDISIQQQVDKFDIIYCEYEDQSHLNNGRWLHIETKDNKQLSLSIDDMDFFYIGERK